MQNNLIRLGGRLALALWTLSLVLTLMTSVVGLAVAAPTSAPASGPPAAVKVPGSPVSPIPVNIGGLSATACGSTAAAAVNCPAGYRVTVSSVFYGRDLVGNKGLPGKTCPGTKDNITTCALAPRDQAALTQRVARLCDAQRSCSPTAALASVYSNPCAGVTKFLRVDYSCFNVNRNPPPSPAPVPPRNLFRKRPSTAASYVCPKYSAGVANATSSAAFWASQTIAIDGKAVRLSLAFVDIDISTLDGFIKTATGGLYGLDQVLELNLTAVNLHVPSGKIAVIGRSNQGFTTLRINAVNIIASETGAIDVHSFGADASGNFGPKVEITVANVFGPLQIMQNGLTAKHPAISSTNYVAEFEMTQILNGAQYQLHNQLAFISWCNPDNWGSQYTQPYPPLCPTGSSKTTFLPFCTSGIPKNNCRSTYWNGYGEMCVDYTANITATTYYGAALLGGKQNDSTQFNLALDRFTWPRFRWSSRHDFAGKSAVYGTSSTKAAQFFASDGTPASNVASWPTGVFSTADYSIALSTYPNWPYLNSRLANDGDTDDTWDASRPGMLGIMLNMSSSPPRQPPNKADWYPFLNNSCGFAAFGYSVLSGNISYSGPTKANPATFPGLNPLALRLASGCIEEAVSSRRFVDAQAVAADLAVTVASLGQPATDPSLAASLGHLMGIVADLRTNRKGPVTKDVPFLSTQVYQQQAAAEVQGLLNLAAQASTLTNRLATTDAASAAVQSGAAQAQAQVTSLQIDVTGTIQHIKDLQSVANAFNKTYNEKLASANVTAAEFTKAIKLAIAGSIADLAIKFILDIGMIAFGDFTAIKGIQGVAKEGTKFAELIEDAESLAVIIDSIGKLLQSIQALDAALSSLVNAIYNQPSNPNIAISKSMQNQFNSNTASLKALSVAALSFQELHDKATIAFGPAIVNKISYASDYALSLAEVADAGLDMINAQIQLLSAKNALVRYAMKLQAAQAAQARIQGIQNALQVSNKRLQEGVFEVRLGLLDWKMRLLDTVYSACRAYEYAFTKPCPASIGGADPSSSAAVFASSVNQAMQAISTAFDATQCFCNASWIETGKSFIGNLSSTGRAVLDLTNVNKPELAAYFSSFENIHIHQMNLKPYGIRAVSGVIPQVPPTLTLLITPSGNFTNVFVSPNSGTLYSASYLATPYTLAMQVQPTANWAVNIPGSLSNQGSGKYYVPTPFARFSIRESPDDSVTWDWSKVWGVQVELWGFLRAKQVPGTGGVSKPAGMVKGSIKCQTCPVW